MPHRVTVRRVQRDLEGRTDADAAGSREGAWAHVAEDGRTHALEDHLREVGRLAGEFATPFGGGPTAEIAGLWHDLGKYAADFQAKLRAARAEAVEAHVERSGDARARVDHSTAGAFHATTVRGGADSVPIAFAIAGHHAGLADRADLHRRLTTAGKARLAAAESEHPPAALVAHPFPSLPTSVALGATPDPDALRRVEMFTRMVFSALVDADFLDTEAFFDTDRSDLRGGHAPLATLASRLSGYVDGLTSDDSDVNRVRAAVRDACRRAASGPRGVLTLTVPTGGGKTLASMELALEHALAHGMRRVVVAIPYTSILEQNAAVYRSAFGLEDGDPSVLEHHSAVDPDRETARSRVACENWDAPVVVTTNVQLLQSLLGRRSSVCRKLHRLAGSVIVLDEAQTLPRGLLAPTTDVLEALVRDYGCTLVLCTATQPALGRAVLGDCGFATMREVVPDPVALADRLRRVAVDWSRTKTPVSWAQLAEEVAREPDVLAIVHRRNDAHDLCAEIDARLGDTTTIHLSALMCPAHRRRVLDEIASRKRRGVPVRLVATQLVEAGVDLDFPIVYRALAGVDSLTQAAGRCNREGRRATLGDLRVFLAPTEPPPGILGTALGVTRTMLARGAIDLFAPSTHADYFQRLYSAGGDGVHDEFGIQAHRARLNFETVASAYRIVDDAWSAPLVVPIDDTARRAIAEVERLGPSRARMRALQRYTVQVSRRDRAAWVRAAFARHVAEDAICVLDDASAYDARFGLVPARIGELDPDGLVV